MKVLIISEDVLEIKDYYNAFTENLTNMGFQFIKIGDDFYSYHESGGDQYSAIIIFSTNFPKKIKALSVPVIGYINSVSDYNTKKNICNSFLCPSFSVMTQIIKETNVDPNLLFVISAETELSKSKSGADILRSMIEGLQIPKDVQSFNTLKNLALNTPFNREVAKENLLLLKEVFDEEGLPFFLFFGTLLGAVREGNFIVHDKDTDLVLFESYRTKFHSILPKIEVKGLQFVRSVEGDRVLSLYRNGEYIDLYFILLKNIGLNKKWYIDFATIPKKLMLDSTKISFLGTKFMVPENYKKILKILYGSKWETPIIDYPANHDYYMKFQRFIKKKNKIKAALNFLRWRKGR